MKAVYTLIFILLVESRKTDSQSILTENGLLSGHSCVSSDTVTNGKTNDELWLKSAQLVAFCIEKYGNISNESSSGINQLCLSSSCKSCLTVCQLRKYTNESGCWSQCGLTDTVACKTGCSFYLQIHGLNSTGYLNISSKNAPNATILPDVFRTSYNYMDLTWNTTVAHYPIVYVIFSREHYTDTKDIGQFIPIDMTMEGQKKITSEMICKHFWRANHHRGIKFAYKLIAVSKDGYSLTSPAVNRFKETAFQKADYLVNVSLGDSGNFHNTMPYEISYKVQWTVNTTVESFITKLEVSDRIKHCAVPSIDFVSSVEKQQKSAFQKVSLPFLHLKGCTFEFTVLPLVGCLHGIPKRTSIFYPGCHIFSNAPAACKPTEAPRTLPPIVAGISSENFRCTSYKQCQNSSGDLSCMECANGVYDMTMSWNTPNPENLTVVGVICKLFTFQTFPSGHKFPKEVGSWSLNPSAKQLGIFNLTTNTEYSFKVHAKSSSKDTPMFFALAGLKFVTKGIPQPTTSAATSTLPTTIFTLPWTSPVTSTSSSTTSSSTTTAWNVAAKGRGEVDQKTGLAVGLGLSLSVLALCFIIVLYIKVRRRLQEKRKLVLQELEPVSYLARPLDSWELSLEDIVFGEALGEGAFGKVYVATVSGVRMQCPSISCETLNSYVKMGASTCNVRSSGITIKAAVKVLQDRSDEHQRSDFLEEINLMKEVGQHKNIVSMLGCVTQGTALCLVVEYMPYGDLLHYLRGRRSKILGHAIYTNQSLHIPKYVYSEAAQAKSTECLMPDSPAVVDTVLQESSASDDTNERKKPGSEEEILPEDLLRFSWQIASGMEFLSRKGFVHRDLAARNVLVGPNKSCKISDFGLTRLVYEEKVYMGRKSRKLPIKWMSIEAIIDQCFTTYSDVWSFGVLLFEIVTLGGTPYPTMTGQDLLRFLRSGNRMEKPENCSDEIYTVMKACWLRDPVQRPTFTDIRERFENLISEGTPYVEFDIDNSQPYYNVPSFISIEESTEDSLSDDQDGIEADWDSRFTTLDRRINSGGSANQRYADASGDDKGFLAPDVATEYGAAEYGAAEYGAAEYGPARGPFDSVSSDASVTPLVDGILQPKTEVIHDSTLQHNGDASPVRQDSYSWAEQDKLRNNNSVPSTPVAAQNQQRDLFIVDHYINMEPRV